MRVTLPMWQLKAPGPAKLVVAMLGADRRCLLAGREAVEHAFGHADLASDIWPFDQTDYYKQQTGGNILRQLLSIEKLIDPVKLAGIKLRTNKLEKRLAAKLQLPLPRPVNLDPGIIEPSKLVLATTKNYAHRIYIGKKIYAEVTLIFEKGRWRPLEYTYPDYTQQVYLDFFARVRARLLEQLRDTEGARRSTRRP